jgi:hypothetical protein
MVRLDRTRSNLGNAKNACYAPRSCHSRVGGNARRIGYAGCWAVDRLDNGLTDERHAPALGRQNRTRKRRDIGGKEREIRRFSPFGHGAGLKCGYEPMNRRVAYAILLLVRPATRNLRCCDLKQREHAARNQGADKCACQNIARIMQSEDDARRCREQRKRQQ